MFFLMTHNTLNQAKAILDNVLPDRVSIALFITLTKAGGFWWHRARDPLKLEHFKVKCVLPDVGGIQCGETSDFVQDTFDKSYLTPLAKK